MRIAAVRGSGRLRWVNPGLAVSYYGIALGETAVAWLLLVSLVRGEIAPGRAKPILKFALAVAALMFGALACGQRLSHDYTGAADLFFYFGATLVALWTVERAEEHARP